MSEKLKNILSETPCPDVHQFYDYVEDSLNTSKKREFENHLTDCPFCSDALDGFELSSRTTTLQNLELINSNINAKKSKYYIWYAAASFLILFGVGALLMNNIYEKTDVAVEYQENEKEEVISKPNTQKKVELEETNSEPSEDLNIVEQNEIIIEDDEVKILPQEDDSEMVEISNISKEVRSIDSEPPKSLSTTPNIQNKTLSEDDIKSGVELQDVEILNESITKDKNDFYMLAFTENILLEESNSAAPSISPNDKYDSDYSYIRKLSKKSEPKSISSDAEKEKILSDFELGLNEYNSKNFKQAITLLESSIKVGNEKAIIYKTLSQIQINKEKEALKTIESINKNSTFYFDALWLKVYILKSKNKDYSKELKELKSTPNKYTEQVTKIE